MKRIIENLIGYIKETRAEAKKVVWPDRRYVTVATIVILFLVLITSIYVVGIDFVLGKFFAVFLKQ
jgi:preprotein translocase SecE subunit